MVLKKWKGKPWSRELEPPGSAGGSVNPGDLCQSGSAIPLPLSRDM